MESFVTPLAIGMYLDSDSEAAIRDIWKDLAEAGVTSYMLDSGDPPHVTLAICNELDTEEFEARLRSFAKELSPFAVTLSNVGIFPRGVVFLAPTVTHKLLDIHSYFHRFVRDVSEPSWENYLLGRWVPHCTLAMDLDPNLVPKAVEICGRASLPMRGQIVEIGVVEFRPVVQLFSFKLEE